MPLWALETSNSSALRTDGNVYLILIFFSGLRLTKYFQASGIIFTQVIFSANSSGESVYILFVYKLKLNLVPSLLSQTHPNTP